MKAPSVKVKDNLQESVCPFHLQVPGIEFRSPVLGIRLAGQYLCRLHHLICPGTHFLMKSLPPSDAACHQMLPAYQLPLDFVLVFCVMDFACGSPCAPGSRGLCKIYLPVFTFALQQPFQLLLDLCCFCFGFFSTTNSVLWLILCGPSPRWQWVVVSGPSLQSADEGAQLQAPSLIPGLSAEPALLHLSLQAWCSISSGLSRWLSG